MISKFLKIDGLKKKIDQLRPLRPEIIATLREKLQIEWIYNSNAIEGNTLTLGETAFFLREGLTSEGKPLKDFLEAKNHLEALEGLDNVLKKKRPLSESVIKELHAILMKGVASTLAKGADGKPIQKPLHPGKYKTWPNHVLTLTGKIHYYVDPLHVKDEMETLVAWVREAKGLHPIEKAARFHYRFVEIHPFDDGNGRLARILMNLILMKQGYPPCIIRNLRRRKYLEALEMADLRGNPAPFVTFIAEELLATLENMSDALSAKGHPVEAESGSMSLNREERERLILRAIGRKSLSIRQILSLLPKIKRPTLKSDLHRLVSLRRLQCNGIGKASVYICSSKRGERVSHK